MSFLRDLEDMTSEILGREFRMRGDLCQHRDDWSPGLRRGGQLVKVCINCEKAFETSEAEFYALFGEAVLARARRVSW